MVTRALWVIVCLVALVILSCGGGKHSEPLPELGLGTSTGGAPATPGAQPTTTITARAPLTLQHFEGQTMAFDYPVGWYVWNSRVSPVNLGIQERVVISTAPPQPEEKDLPAGAIKIVFEGTGGPRGPIIGLSEAHEVFTAGPEEVEFGVFRNGAAAPWSVHGATIKDNCLYYASAYMNTEEPALEMVRPILETWTLNPPTPWPSLSPSPTQRPGKITPTPTATPVTLQHFEGQTMAFDYPADWHIWRTYFDLTELGTQEQIVLANIPPQPDEMGLPPEAIRMVFESDPRGGWRVPIGEAQQVWTLGPNAVKFGLFQDVPNDWRLTETVAWKLAGATTKGTLAYHASALVNTEEPALGIVTPILESWTLKPPPVATTTPSG